MNIFHFEGLKPGQEYKFQVVATSLDGSIKSAPSNIKSFTAIGDDIPPAAPTSPVVDFTTTTYSMTWSGPDISDTPDFYDYKIILSNVANTASKTFYVRDKNFNFTLDQNSNLFGTPTASIVTTIQSRDTTGNLSQPPLSASGVNPAPTESPTVSASGIIQGISATWNAPTSAFSDYAYTEIYATSSATYSASSTTAVWRGNSTNAQYSPVSTYTPLYVKGRHFDVFGQPGPDGATSSATPINPDSTDTTPPGTASVVAASFSGTTAEVYFKRPPDSDLNSFKINISSPTSTASPNIMYGADVSASDTVQIFRLSFDQNSSYFGSPSSSIFGKIYSRDRTGNTSSSYADFSVTKNFEAPSVTYNNVQWGSSADGLSAGTLGYTVSWDDVSACPAFGYSKVFESTTGATSGFSQVYQGTNNNVSINALSNQRWVYVQHYTVFNVAGSSAVPKTVTPNNPVIVNTTAPTNATSLIVSASNDGGATGFSGRLVASWTQSTASNVRGYRLRVRQANETYFQYENTASNTTQYNIAGLVPGENYEVAIAAYDELNNTSSYTLANSYAIIPYSSSVAEVLTITAASNSTNISITGAVSASMVGMTILGYGITGGTIISGSFATGSLTLSQPTFATISASAASLTYGVSNLTSYIAAGTSSYMKFGTGVSGTQSGLHLDTNNYWYTSGNFRVGTASAFTLWDGTSLKTSGDIVAKSGSFDGNVIINSGGTLISGALPSVAGARVVMNSQGISASRSDGTNTFVLSSTTGQIGASSGTIAGWTLGPASFVGGGGKVILDSSGSAFFGDAGSGSSVSISGIDSTYRLWIGSTAPSSAPFRVDKIGGLYANSASITGDITATNGYFNGDVEANTLTLTGNQLIFGSIIAASAIRISSASRNAAGSAVIYTSGAHPFTTGASVSIGGVGRGYDGIVTASIDGGSTASFTYVSPGTTGSVSATDLTNSYAASYNSGRRVQINSSGLYAYDDSNAQIFTMPTVKGGTPQIAGWYFTSSSFSAGTAASTVGLAVPSASTDVVIWAGAAAKNTASFRVTAAGNASFTNAYLSGSVVATSGSIGGWQILSDRITGGTTGTTVSISSVGPTSIWAGDATATSAPFRVTNTGVLFANSGSIGGLVMTSSAVQTNYLYLYTSVYNDSYISRFIPYTSPRLPASAFYATETVVYPYANNASNIYSYDRSIVYPATIASSSVTPIVVRKIGGTFFNAIGSNERSVQIWPYIPNSASSESGGAISAFSTYASYTGIITDAGTNRTYIMTDSAGDLKISADGEVNPTGSAGWGYWTDYPTSGTGAIPAASWIYLNGTTAINNPSTVRYMRMGSTVFANYTININTASSTSGSVMYVRYPTTADNTNMVANSIIGNGLYLKGSGPQPYNVVVQALTNRFFRILVDNPSNAAGQMSVWTTAVPAGQSTSDIWYLQIRYETS